MAIKLVHNVETGEVSEVELTAEEVAQRAKDAADYAKAKADEDKAAADKATAKAALLAKLGITADEAALLA
jgi:hypothetical protein